MNNNYEYGIIGLGTVGKAVLAGFQRNKIDCWTFDKKINVGPNTYKLNKTKVVFICVNTPSKGGQYDTYNLREALEYLTVYDYKGVVVVVSTIGYKQFSILYNEFKGFKFNLIVSPEFLTAKNAEDDFYFGNANILYGPWINKTVDDIFRKAMKSCKSPYLSFDRRSIAECLAIKTGTNLALFIKLISANMIYSEALDQALTRKQAQSIVDTIFSDPRLESRVNYHTIGNNEGTLGIGGACLPKDVQAKQSSQSNHIERVVIDDLVELNNHYRKIKIKSNTKIKTKIRNI